MGEDPSTAGPPVGATAGPPVGATVGPPVGATKDPEQIRDEIEATRQELGDTVEALAAKADVKKHARERIERTKASMPNPVVLGVAAAVAVGLVLMVRRARR